LQPSMGPLVISTLEQSHLHQQYPQTWWYSPFSLVPPVTLLAILKINSLVPWADFHPSLSLEN
jgi:hypothetical protein